MRHSVAAVAVSTTVSIDHGPRGRVSRDEKRSCMRLREMRMRDRGGGKAGWGNRSIAVNAGKMRPFWRLEFPAGSLESRVSSSKDN